MKTRIALISCVALAVVGLGAGLGPVEGADGVAAAPTMVVEIAPEVDTAPVVRRHPLKVLPTVTVVPSREELLEAGLGEEPLERIFIRTPAATYSFAKPN